MRRWNTGDAGLRALERRWLETGDRADALRYVRAAERIGALSPEEAARVEHLVSWSDLEREEGSENERGMVDVDEIAQDLAGGFDRFASWDQIYAELQAEDLRARRRELNERIRRIYDRFRGRQLDQQAEAEVQRIRILLDNVKAETINQNCKRWADEDLRYRSAEVIDDFQKDHGVRLTARQRKQLLSLWDDALKEACRKAFMIDLRRLMEKVVTLVNDASEFYVGEEGYEVRGLLPPARLDETRRHAIRAWREGLGPNAESGVWFTLSRSFIRAMSEAGFCAGVYGRDAARAHPEVLCIRNVTGDDVVKSARWWADCAGDRFELPHYPEDPSNHIDYPTDERAMEVVLEAGPLKKATPRRRPRR